MNETVREAYAARAAEYSAVLGSIAATSAVDQELIREWSSKLHGRVVDAGCGPGHWTAFLHELGVDVEGVDPVQAFVDQATRRFPGVPFRVGSFGDLDEGDAAGILAWYSLIHLHPYELPGVLAGFARSLAPQGSLLLGFFTGETLEPFAHAVTTAYYWPVAEMAAALAGAGFRVDETQTHTRTDPGSRPHAAMVARLAVPTPPATPLSGSA